MPESSSINLPSELPRYGIDDKSVRWLDDGASAELIDYLHIIQPQGPNASGLITPDGVVENQERPLLYFVSHGRLAEPPKERALQIEGLRRALACRGDRAYLAVIRPGKLDVIPVSLKDKNPDWQPYVADSPEGVTFFSRLALGVSEDFPSGGDVDYLFREISSLVEKTAESLANLKVKRTDVISLVGRVLFFRFLRDRGVVTEGDRKKIAPQASSLARCFENAENAAATSRWLDKTFNGDFLPLTDDGSIKFFESKGKASGQKLFHHLTVLLMGEEATTGGDSQRRLGLDESAHTWGELDFAHIPVGLLSQVYEKLSWKWHRESSKKNSVHYTPRNIAATLVGEAFDNLENAHSAKILDPACGASVFLVLAFRRLYRELWSYSGERPDTKAIRSILENQLVGFDVSDSALKLSALSLYLTAIELDPDPVPLSKLKFKALCEGDRNKKPILYDWRKADDKEKGPVVGSIGKHVGERFNASFDLILCNPPWTNIGSQYAKVSEELDEVSKAIVTSLSPEIGRDYKNPDSVPDLPFIWRSMQWCKSGGRIAMALPARTLFKQGSRAETTRKALFSLLEVNGIINCSNLRKTKVWPEMNHPFMLLFARNRRPKPHHRLQFISPHTDLHANSLGEMRIDSKSAQLVDIEQTIKEPWIWKALAVGTMLDMEVVRKIKASELSSLEDHWKNELGLVCSSGYQIKETQTVRKSAKSLQKLYNLNSTRKFRFEVDITQLEKFSHDTAFRTRINEKKADPLEVYRGPIVLVKESPGATRSQGWALICSSDIAYNQSFYGYSAAGLRDGYILTRYLQLFAHSSLWQYYALTTSAKFGFERPNVYKQDLDNCPFPPFENLDSEQQEEVRSLSSRLLKEDLTVFSDIDDFFGKIYGLSSADMEVVKDTLEVREPNDELGKRASEWPTNPERKIFCRRLESHLRPFFRVLGKQPKITVWKPSEAHTSPFVIFTLMSKGDVSVEPSELFQSKVLPLAHQTGSSQIIEVIEGGLLIAVLRQYRYWTPSRARLLGAEIIREHMNIFED